MNIVCMSSLRDTPGYVARRVAEFFPRTKLIQIVSSSRKSSLSRKLRRALQGAWLRRLEHRVYYRGYFHRGSRRLEQLLHGSAPHPPLAASARILSSEINHLSTAAVLESLRPDVLLVAGAPILKPHIFGIPRLAAMNVHFGISPRYRGEHTLFWPMYYRDYANVGVTIHLIDKGIDTGRILAQGFLGLAAEDNEWALVAKASRSAAELVIDLLREGLFQPRWQPPSVTRGHNFNFNGRRLWHDVWYAARRHCLGERPQSTVAHATNYCFDPHRAAPATTVISSTS